MSSTHSTNTSDLCKAMLYPGSVALVGASDDTKKTGGRPQQFLRRAGFAGKVYPINPNRAQVQGEQAWPSLAAGDYRSPRRTASRPCCNLATSLWPSRVLLWRAS